MPLPLDEVPIFLVVAEEGSFASAGRKLNLSRSAVGKSVARLEEQTGVRLLHRSTRSHTLTPEGELLYDEARSALARLEGVGSALSGLAHVASGTLRVTVPVVLGRLVARILQELAAAYPELSLQVTFTDHIVDLIEDGIDLAIRLGPLPDASALATKRLARMEMVLCTAPKYLEERGQPADIAALAGHDGIFYARARHIEPWRLGPVALDGAAAPRPRVKFDDLEAMTDAAVAGLGIAWLPTWLVSEHLEQARLVELLPAIKSIPYTIHAVWPRSTPMPLRLRSALDFLSSRLQSLMDGSTRRSD
jgi:DNA-binding transcriptional LysR family regulator